MSRPYETEYRHERRSARHRCLCCARIINAGESVLMWKASAKVTRVVHLHPCARGMASPPHTYRDLAIAQSAAVRS